MMADSRLYVHVLLDRSGSMEACSDTTIDAFNEYVKSLMHQSRSGTRLSLTTFNSESIDVVFDALKINDVPQLTRDTFVPRAMTPLFDAVGQTVASIDKVTLLPDERVAFAILTDGLENASREIRPKASANCWSTGRSAATGWCSISAPTRTPGASAPRSASRRHMRWTTTSV